MNQDDPNAKVYVYFLKERLKPLEKALNQLKKVDEYNQLLPEVKAYQDCLTIFTTLFNVK